MDSDEDVFEVEKIVDNVVVGRKTYFRVRWKNYDEDGDTWEPRENLLSCEDLLNNYIRAQSEKTSGLTLPPDVFTAAGSGSDNTQEGQATSDKKKPTRQRKIKKKEEKPKIKKGPRRRVEIHSTSSGSSSSEEPHVKDPFWENLERGKIDVFASDLYSKVKQRRFPEKEQEQEITEKTAEKPKKAGKKKNDDILPQDVKKAVPEKDVAEKPGEEKAEKEKEKKEEEEEIPSPEEAQEPQKFETNPVLQYLEKEILNKKETKGKKQREKEGKAKKSVESKKKMVKRNVFEPTKADAPEAPEEKVEEETSKLAETMCRMLDLSKNISKPNVVLEKIPTPKKIDDGLDSGTKKREKPTKSMQKSLDSVKKSQKITQELSEKAQRDVRKSERETEVKTEQRKASEEKRSKKISKEDTKEAEKNDENNKEPPEVPQKLDEPKNGANKGKKEQKQYEPMDAFSAQLQGVDSAVSDLMLKKKEKSKKKSVQNTRHSPSGEKISSPTQPTPSGQNFIPPQASVSGTSVLEMLTNEMERTANMGTTNMDPKLSPFDAAVKDAHVKLGLKPPTTPIFQDKPQVPSCSPDMVEFLKIKVNFELDEISVKDIERHHEMGEPPCRLERDVTNAEFRQYIKSNNFEMVHEALKSKKMMYNLEHTDSVWMTQLMVAAAAGYDEIVKVLAHHGARVNARSKIGQTTLMFAAEKGHDIVCRILIAYGAYINLQTTSGETALMKATKNGFSVIVRYLLQAGADPSLKSVHGTTALEMAERGPVVQIPEMLRAHENNINACVNDCIYRECVNLGIRMIGLPILATRLYNIRETASIHVTFNCVLQSLPPNQGLLLFAVHGMIGSGLTIKCRLRGPCYVNAVTLNNFVMDAMMPGKQPTDGCSYFLTNLVWKAGQNSLRLFLSQDPLSSEKLFITIFTCGLSD